MIEKSRLTEEDIVNRAAGREHAYAIYRRRRDEERQWQAIVNEVATRPRTLMDKRKMEPFHLVNPTPISYSRKTYANAEESARRIRSPFEQELIAKQSAQATRAGYLLTGFALFCFAACLVWKFWGSEISKLFQ